MADQNGFVHSKHDEFRARRSLADQVLEFERRVDHGRWKRVNLSEVPRLFRDYAERELPTSAPEAT